MKKLLVVSVLFAGCGCANLPDMRRIQGNMDTMVGYMGMMAYNTSQMAQAADRMQRKSDTLLANLEKKSSSAERAIQNYSQAVLDNDRAVIRNLQGIRDELGQIKQNLTPATGASRTQQERGPENANLKAKLEDLEKKLATIDSKMEKLGPRNQ